MRHAWIAILLGLALGIGVGLALGWYLPINPVQTDPSVLSPQWQSDWILMTAEAYSLDGNLDAARQRVAMLSANNPAARVVQRGQEAIAEGLPPAYIGALARLAAALGARPQTLAPYLSK